MTFVLTPDIKTGHSIVTTTTQHIPAKFRKYLIPFRVQKRSKFLFCFLGCWNKKRPSLAIDEIAKPKYHNRVSVFPSGSEVSRSEVSWHSVTIGARAVILDRFWIRWSKDTGEKSPGSLHALLGRQSLTESSQVILMRRKWIQMSLRVVTFHVADKSHTSAFAKV